MGDIMGDKYDIKSYNQSGGITAGKIYIDTRGQRRICEMYGFEEELLGKLPKGKNAEITIISKNGDSEAYNFAKEIMEYISSKGWTNIIGVNTMIGAKPMYDVQINNTKNKFSIQVGERKSY